MDAFHPKDSLELLEGAGKELQGLEDNCLKYL